MQQVGVVLAGASVLQAEIIGRALPSDAVRVLAVLPGTERILEAIRETGARVVILPVRTSPNLSFSRTLASEEPNALLLLLVRRRRGSTVDLFEFRCVARDVWDGQLAESIRDVVARMETAQRVEEP